MWTGRAGRARFALAKGNGRACREANGGEGAKLLSYLGMIERDGGGRIITEIGKSGRNLSEMREAVQNEAGRLCAPENLEYQHRVPVGVEAVTLRAGRRVGREHSLAPCERRDEHEQRRARKMEVGDHALDDAELVWRENEE